MIKWIYKPSGLCPVQAEGYFLGYYFYFRSRWSTATIEFAKSGKEWAKGNSIVRYELYETASFEAGYISPLLSRLLIWKGCLKFLFRKR